MAGGLLIRPVACVCSDMMFRHDRPDEAKAKYVMETIDGTRLVLRDGPGAPDGMHDFDVERGSEVVGAVEVTMMMDPPREQLNDAVAKWGDWRTPELHRSWHVALSRDAAHGFPRQVFEA